jgi:hypothetical protein
MYTPKTTPMRHQTDAIAACQAKPPVPCPADVFAYLCDMGTGKSKIVLDEWGEMATNGGCKDMLVVAPAGSYRNWYIDKDQKNPELWSELRKHVDPEMFERMLFAGWRSGGGGKSLKEQLKYLLATKDPKRPRALFVNVEALSTVDAAQELCREFVDQRGAHLIIDESTIIKSHKAERTKICWELGDAALSKRILSGLWTPKGPLDLFSQCYFLDPRILGQTNFFAFQRKYAQMVRQDFGGRKFWQVVGYQNLEELQKRVAPYSYRVLKSDCLDLEPKNYTSVEVDLTPEQKRMISEIKLFGHASIGDTGRFVTTDMIIKQIARITQIGCGYVVDDEEHVIHEIPENRTETLLGVLLNHRGKAVVWVPWRHAHAKVVKALKMSFGPKSVAEFHGGNRKDRHLEEQRFLTDPQCRFMVATQGAGMRGNTWVVANLVVYYANNYDLEQRDQSEDRAHRKGQTERVTYVDLISPGTNDENIVKNLRKKISLSSMINGEGYRTWLV